MTVCPFVRMNAEIFVCPSVRLSVRMNTEISETMRARLLRFGEKIPEARLLSFGVQIPELLTQRKVCHAHLNDHKPPKPVTFTATICHAHSNAHNAYSGTPTLTPITLKSVYRVYLHLPLVPLAE